MKPFPIKQLTSEVLIILAGGKSSRMGFPKGLLMYKGKYWLEEQLNRAVEANFNQVILVLGFDQLQYFKKVPFLNNAVHKPIDYYGIEIHVIINKKPQFGAFSSLIEALKCIKEKKSVFVLPIDVPLLSKHQLLKIKVSNSLVTIPKYKQQKGHPVKLKYDFWKLLIQMDINDDSFRLDYQINKLNLIDIQIIDVNHINAVLNLNSRESWENFLLLNK